MAFSKRKLELLKDLIQFMQLKYEANYNNDQGGFNGKIEINPFFGRFHSTLNSLCKLEIIDVEGSGDSTLAWIKDLEEPKYGFPKVAACGLFGSQVSLLKELICNCQKMWKEKISDSISSDWKIEVGIPHGYHQYRTLQSLSALGLTGEHEQSSTCMAWLLDLT